jgi:hypothetical protein
VGRRLRGVEAQLSAELSSLTAAQLALAEEIELRDESDQLAEEEAEEAADRLSTHTSVPTFTPSPPIRSNCQFRLVHPLWAKQGQDQWERAQQQQQQQATSPLESAFAAVASPPLAVVPAEVSPPLAAPQSLILFLP